LQLFFYFPVFYIIFRFDIISIDGVDEGGEERVAATLSRNYIPDPFTIKTFGFGRDVCPRLMNEIAHMKEG
jgi:hypothetical protein